MDPDGNDLEGFVTKLGNLHNLRIAAHRIVTGAIESGSRFVLSEEMIRGMHRICMSKLLEEAGNYRSVPVSLRNSPYVPPNASDVPVHMIEFCKFVNVEWTKRDLVYLAAFCLWRLNWIHPFRNGNGRISREISYIVMNARAGRLFPTKNSVVEQIAGSHAVRQQYEAALRHADSVYAATSDFDACLRPMQELLGDLLKKQLRANLP